MCARACVCVCARARARVRHTAAVGNGETAAGSCLSLERKSNVGQTEEHLRPAASLVGACEDSIDWPASDNTAPACQRTRISWASELRGGTSRRLHNAKASVLPLQVQDACKE